VALLLIVIYLCSMYFLTSHWFIKIFYPSLIWNIPTKEKTIFLTFDDGPTPDVTEKVLDLLNQYNAKATFFCLGKNVVAHPDLFKSIINQGHAVGNHTYNHLHGWKTEDSIYFDDVQQCKEAVNSLLFRPPYGRIKFSQIRKLKHDYKIIMWDILSGDFDKNLSKEKSLSVLLNTIRKDSIVVYHDSIKASEKMLYTLPIILEQYSAKGFRFDSINLAQKH
jgi:peptidoglycan-N-acetylglucosamine deacetylase